MVGYLLRHLNDPSALSDLDFSFFTVTILPETLQLL